MGFRNPITRLSQLTADLFRTADAGNRIEISEVNQGTPVGQMRLYTGNAAESAPAGLSVLVQGTSPVLTLTTPRFDGLGAGAATINLTGSNPAGTGPREIALVCENVRLYGKPLVDVGAVTRSGLFTAAAGWTITQSCLDVGFLKYAFVTVTRTGAAITVGVTGNIANQTIATLNNLGNAPLVTTPLGVGTTGRLAAFSVQPNGTLALTAVDAGEGTTPQNIATSEVFSCGGMWIVPGG